MGLEWIWIVLGSFSVVWFSAFQGGFIRLATVVFTNLSPIPLIPL